LPVGASGGTGSESVAWRRYRARHAAGGASGAVVTGGAGISAETGAVDNG
jgi:hypothetical protein